MNTPKPIWQKPWKYKEGILISLTLLILGTALEYASGGSGILKLIVYPNNLYLGAGLIIFIVFLSFFGKQYAVKQWLESIPAAICSISLLLFVSLLMGLTLQYDNGAPELIRKLGLSHVLTSWPYLFANLFILLSLGMATIKNLKTFELRKLGYIVSHLGLWIVIFGANFGSSQLLRLQMEVTEGSISNIAIDKSTNTQYEMPFAIKLNDFILEEYNSKLAIVSNETGKLIQGNGKNIILIDTAVNQSLLGWQIFIEEYNYSSVKAGDRYYFVNERGAAPSALVSVIDKAGDTISGWISCGSFNRPYESLKLNDEFSLIMLFPEPKEFTSEIEILQKNGNHQELSLQVNKPTTVDGWKIYQLSYDSELGRWSDVSVFELIHDPWLPVVYIGIFLMLAGAVYMFWMGSKNKSEKSQQL
ncbi:MAG: cytochrome c biogenesis protein ResB [Bacteroidota bacterium]